MSAYNDADYLELMIRHLFRDSTMMQEASNLGLKPEDFGTIGVYRAFTATAMEIGEAPIDPTLCLARLRPHLKTYDLGNDDDTVVNMWEFIYRGELISASHMIESLTEFIKFRRFQLLKFAYGGTPEALIEESNKLVGDIALRKSTGEIRELDPFRVMVLVEHRESLLTGFAGVDTAARGLNYQELGLILGHSGSGKTAMAIYSALQNAKQFRSVLYISLEEPAENISCRLYSNVFRIPYTALHKGDTFAQQDLKNAWTNVPCREREALQNLKVHDLRYAAPITAKYIKNYLDKLYHERGYHPDLVYIDQMDYMTSTEKYDSAWQKYEKVAFEVKELTNHLIGGKHPFSVWLLHQAGGKMTKSYTNADISGFKGVIKPADMVLAIGRDSAQDSMVSIFSLKSRHAKNFKFDFLAELEFMNFEQMDRGAEDRAKEEDADKKVARRKGNFTNIPARAPLLPAAGTGFHSSV